MRHFDFVIVGAGVVGLTVARVLAQRRLGGILVLEKEAALGCHSSGRNSGVLHSGIYYGPDSFKAKVCAAGARRMREYAQERGIAMRKTGKVIVADSSEAVSQLDNLYDRAVANGARVEKIDLARLREIEPEAMTVDRALYSPDTAVIDAHEVLEHLEKDVLSMGVEIVKSSAVRGVDAKNRAVQTAAGSWQYGHLINAAGLHADTIAHAMGVGERYQILPFKGLYRKLLAQAAARIRGSIYPVPDLRMPFLGVHLTRTVHDDVIVGPTALPALGRENYGVLDGLDARDLPRILKDLVLMVLHNKDGMRALVKEESMKYWGPGFLRRVQVLAPAIAKEDFAPGTAKVGIRAQLVDKRTMSLVMDFVVEDGPASTHVLNAISPAFTGSLAFADIIADRICARKH